MIHSVLVHCRHPLQAALLCRQPRRILLLNGAGLLKSCSVDALAPAGLASGLRLGLSNE